MAKKSLGLSVNNSEFSEFKSKEKFPEGIAKVYHLSSIQVAKRNELHTFKIIPKRWVVERSFSWLDKC